MFTELKHLSLVSDFFLFRYTQKLNCSENKAVIYKGG